MSSSVGEFYNANAQAELARLDLPLCRIEAATTWRLIDRYFPKAGSICDVGSGPGKYAVELLRLRYAVTLVDVSSEEIGLAEEIITNAGLKAEGYIVGDARDLSQFGSGSFDAALFLGPLYHIVDREERIASLKGLRRILIEGGVATIAYLNSWGLIKTGITDFPGRYREIDKLRCMLDENAFLEGELSNFTECFWSTPPRAIEEISEAGFEIITYAGAESFANGMGSFLSSLEREDVEAYENIIKVAAETSELAQYRDSTDHIHFVVKKI